MKSLATVFSTTPTATQNPNKWLRLLLTTIEILLEDAEEEGGQFRLGSLDGRSDWFLRSGK